MLRIALAALASTLLAQAQQPADKLTGTERTPNFEIRFRPGSKAEASVDRVKALVEDDLALILRELGLEKFPHTIRLFLYDDVQELQKVTGVPSGGHSTPLESHVPHDNDQTRVHELVHVVAEKFGETGAEPRNLFFAEGLANAVLRFVTGVHVDAVAAFYLERKQIPSLAEVQALPDFYAWLRERPGYDAYDVAGSYLRWLLDTHGPAKVRRYYVGVPPREAFGVDLAALEKGWHEHLAKVSLRPGLRSLLEERLLLAAERKNPREARLGDAVLGPAASWTKLAFDAVRDADLGLCAKGDASAFVLSGRKSIGDWCVARLSDDSVADALVRCKAEALPGCFGVQIQLGIECQALVLRGQGTFVYRGDKGVAFEPRVQLHDGPVEIVLRRIGDKASVWIGGELVAEAKVAGEPAALGIGCVGGKARFTEVAIRKL